MGDASVNKNSQISLHLWGSSSSTERQGQAKEVKKRIKKGVYMKTTGATEKKIKLESTKRVLYF